MATSGVMGALHTARTVAVSELFSREHTPCARSVTVYSPSTSGWKRRAPWLVAVHDDAATSSYTYSAFSFGAVSRTSPHERLLRSSSVFAATAVPFGSCAAHASWWLMYSSMMLYRLRFCVSPDVSSSETSGF